MAVDDALQVCPDPHAMRIGEFRPHDGETIDELRQVGVVQRPVVTGVCSRFASGGKSVGEGDSLMDD